MKDGEKEKLILKIQLRIRETENEIKKNKKLIKEIEEILKDRRKTFGGYITQTHFYPNLPTYPYTHKYHLLKREHGHEIKKQTIKMEVIDGILIVSKDI